MLETIQLGFRYAPNKPWVFRKLDLQLAPGNMIFLQGASGVGKSTLCKVLAGFLSPIEGLVRVDGALPEAGYRPVQLLHQHPELTFNPHWKLRWSIEESGESSAAVLDSLQIQTAWLDRYPHELSGGELQRIAVARMLNPRTRYILADEISAMLDSVTQARLWNSLIDYAQSHKIGLVVISHNRGLIHQLQKMASGPYQMFRLK